MKDQEAIQTYGTQLRRSGEDGPRYRWVRRRIKDATPERLRNPLRHNEETVRRGKTVYEHYWVACATERKADGKGTVGQSFLSSSDKSHDRLCPESERREALLHHHLVLNVILDLAS